MHKWSSKSESTQKRARQVLLKFFWLWSKSTINGQSQRSTIWSKSTVNGWHVLTWQCDVTLGLTWQYVKQSRHMGRVGERGSGAWGTWERMRDTDGAWWHVECVLARQKLQAACGSACDVVSGRSWLGFARDWLFCRSMPLLWQLDE